MLADYHVHTEYSDDSSYPMERVVKDAIAQGIGELCFTDHVDYGIKEDRLPGRTIRYRENGEPYSNADYPRYVEQIGQLREEYGREIALKLGLEFGMQIHTIPQYEALFARYPFDFILLSIHQIEDKEFWTQDYQRGKSQQEYNEGYYREMLALVKGFRNYSVLGHMDLMVRYDEQGLYPFEKVRDMVEEILKTVIRSGKGIEFNTSYHRYGLKDTTPSVEIWKLYRQLGGEILTIGSDSHKPEHLGAYIREGREFLKGLGFRYFCTYDKMEPTFHPL